MRLMNQVSKAFLGKFIVVYFDEILVFSKIEKEHYEHLKQVIEILEQEKLYSNLKMCTFFSLEVVFLATLFRPKGYMLIKVRLRPSNLGWFLLPCMMFEDFTS